MNVTDVDNTTFVGCKVFGCCLEEEERGAEVGRQDLAPNLRGKYGSVIINHKNANSGFWSCIYYNIPLIHNLDRDLNTTGPHHLVIYDIVANLNYGANQIFLPFCL